MIVDSKSLEPSIILADLREITPAAKESADKSAITIEKIMFATEKSSKVHKISLYEEVVSVPTYSRQYKEAIEDKIQNFEKHQTWEYNNLPDNRKVVGSKWVFKVKYAPDGNIACYKIELMA